MGKKLIITEKPSVARDFARVLNVNGNKNGFIENDEYVVSWCYGHLVEMVYPEVYDEKYKKWRLEDLPFLPNTYKYGVVQSASDQYKIVNSLLHRDDIDVVYWAGDSGKEGQTIEENIRNYGGVREGMTELRVWIDSQTDDEIRRGIREAKPMSDYDLLGKSGIMRTIEDYSLGINFSRALSVKYGRLINDAAATSNYTAIALGRVMTCVLGMVVRREREIRNFVETPFYRVLGNFSDVGFLGEWKAVEGSKYFETPFLYKENGFKEKETASKLIDELSGKEAFIKDIEKGVNKKRAPLLFNLAELQSECSKIFKISPAQALDVVQELYEKKLTTYPRTDARVLSSAIAKEINKNLYGLQKYAPMASFVKEILDNKKYIGLEKTAYTDDKKVTDHYAIIPTGQTQALDSLGSLQKQVYDLIVRRFLSIFFPPAEYNFVKLTISIDNEQFFTSAKALVNPGYLKVTGINTKKESDEDEDESTCSKEELLKFAASIQKDESINVNGFEIKEGKTSPPKRYTSGNLILAMENAGNLIEDEELREQIKKSGIGTSATRGDILEKLVRIKYLNQNPKTQIISPENLGEMIYEVVNLSVPSLLNPEMTANWEMGLEGIINGTVLFDEYRLKLEDYIRKETNKMINLDLTGQITNNIHQFTGKDSRGIATRKPLGINCPVCGGELTTTSFGYGCSNYWNNEIKCNFNLGKVAGVDISEEDFISLITENKTKVISGFTGKNKKSFSASLFLTKDENNKPTVSFNFDEVKPAYIEGYLCPSCSGKIQITPYGYACENRNSSEKQCNFSLGEIAGKKIDSEQFIKLLSNGSTDIINGFKSKNKTSFKAKLVLKDDENGGKTIAFDFDDIAPEELKDVVCPDCGGKMIIRSNGYGCASYNHDDPNSCKFFIGKIAGKSLSSANVTELLKTGSTSTIRGFKGKNGNQFDACLITKKNPETGKTEITFDFENVEAKVIKDVKCPVCGGDIVKTSFGFGCSNYNNVENNCKFNIGSIAGVKLTEKNVKDLLANGQTSLIKGFKSKSGDKFDAYVTLRKNEETGIVEGLRFIFPDPSESIKDLKCPKCGESLVRGKMGFRCINYSKEEGHCNFFVGKIAGLDLSEDQFRKLLTEGKTDLLSGFISKKGMFFDAALKLDEEKNIVFAFENQ